MKQTSHNPEFNLNQWPLQIFGGEDADAQTYVGLTLCKSLKYYFYSITHFNCTDFVFGFFNAR